MSMLDTRQAARARGTPGTMSGRLAALAGAVSFVFIGISASVLNNAPNPFSDSGKEMLTAASTVIYALIEGIMATRFSDLGPAGARVLWTMLLLSIGVILVGLLVVIGATAIVCLRARLFPRWFAVASTVLALASAVGACIIGYAPVGIQIVAAFALIFDCVWILMVSIYFWRDPALTAP